MKDETFPPRTKLLEAFQSSAPHILRSWEISWPLILIVLFDFFINLTDVYIAGLLGKEVQASIGFIAQLYFLFIVVANALTVGTVAVITRLHGAGEHDELSGAVSSISITTIVTGTFLGILTALSGPALLRLFDMPADIVNHGSGLIVIYSAALPFHYYLINTNGILRSTGRVRKSMASMAVVCFLNIGLNFVFVFHTPLGYLGIALSTVASYIVGAMLNSFHLGKWFTGSLKKSFGVVKKIASTGWPAGLLQVFWQIGATMLFLILGALPVNTIEVIAAFTNGLRIEAAIFLPAFALNMANAVVVGNLIGEKRHSDAFRAGIVTAALGVIIISILTAVIVLNARLLSNALSSNPLVAEESVRYLYISMASEPFMAWAVIIGGALNGAGDTKGVMRIVLASQWLVRLPMAYILAVFMQMGPSAIWWSMNASIFVHSLLISIRYFRKGWLTNANREA